MDTAMKKTTMSFIVALQVSMSGCYYKPVIDAKPEQVKNTKPLTTQLDEQQCQNTSKFKGLKYLAPLFSSDTDTKYNDCMRKRGYSIPAN